MNTLFIIIVVAVPAYLLWRYKVCLDAREAWIDDVNSILESPKYSQQTKDFVYELFQDSSNQFLVFSILFAGLKNIFSFKSAVTSKPRKVDVLMKEHGFRDWEIRDVVNPFVQNMFRINFLGSPISYVSIGLILLLAVIVKYLIVAIGVSLSFGLFSNPASAVHKGPTPFGSAKINIYSQAESFMKAEHVK